MPTHQGLEAQAKDLKPLELDLLGGATGRGTLTWMSLKELLGE